MNTSASRKWHYSTVEKFFEIYYEKLLTSNMVCGEEMRIESYKDKNGTEVDCNLFVYPVKKGDVIYLIPTEFKKEMPLLVEKEIMISHKSKGYRLPVISADGKIAVRPMKIKPQKMMSFRELVDNFANGKHDNPDDDLLWRLLVLISYLDRINIRVATPPEFGKDSKINLINAMTGSVGMISNPTIAKLEYLLHNKVLFLNEVSGIGSQSKADIEQFLLLTSDFSNRYTKRSRAGVGSSEGYNITNLSVLIAYNDITQYRNNDKYFDFLWTNAGAINNRILPFLFSGKQLENYHRDFDITDAVNDNWEFYLSWLRTLMHFAIHRDDEDKSFTKEYNFEKNGRWKMNFQNIQKWIGKYVKDKPEFEALCDKYYARHKDYLKMLGFDKLETMPDVIEELVVEEDGQTKFKE